MNEDLRQKAINYFRQKAEAGDKVVYRLFDSAPPEISIQQIAASAEAEGSIGIDEFSKTANLSALYSTIKDCQKCQLGRTRTRFVFGVGNPKAEIMFIGEAPGHDEDIQGEPFVGRAGQLLNRILAAMDLKREDVYIANILKCRPPNNRDPLPEEAETCEPYLMHQVKLIRPKIICCLGRIAAQRLLRTNMTLGQMRERWFSYGEAILMVTYHPAAVLRSQQYKKPLWDDMQKMLAKLKELT